MTKSLEFVIWLSKFVCDLVLGIWSLFILLDFK